MKKIFCLCLALTLLFTLFSCGESNSENEKELKKESEKVCTHQWLEATCQSPKKCSKCGETSGTKSESHTYEADKCKHCGLIQLTLLNYEDYIECNASVIPGISLKGYSGEYIYIDANCSFEATGNIHYKYNNVTLTIIFNHYDTKGYVDYLLESYNGSVEAKPYSTKTGYVRLSIAGNGSYSCVLDTPWTEEEKNYYDTWAIYNQTVYEVVSITGTVEEYK